MPGNCKNSVLALIVADSWWSICGCLPAHRPHFWELPSPTTRSPLVRFVLYKWIIHSSHSCLDQEWTSYLSWIIQTSLLGLGTMSTWANKLCVAELKSCIDTDLRPLSKPWWVDRESFSAKRVGKWGRYERKSERRDSITHKKWWEAWENDFSSSWDQPEELCAWIPESSRFLH